MGDECNVLSHRIDDLESFSLKELKKVEKEIPLKRHVRESPSGEPGDKELEIQKEMKDDYFPEGDAGEPVSQDPENGNFANEKIKLRPDAVPFTPKCVIVTEETEKSEICFENIDLNSQDDHLIPTPKDLINPQPLKEVTLKPFSLSSTPIFKKIIPQVQETTAEEIVISLPTNEPPMREEIQQIQSQNYSVRFLMRNKTQIAVIIASLVICVVLVVYVVL